ncbi:ATP-binding protein [Dokdonella sp.]|uniref:Dph6-related ATP pyrophosphatase n=1 Tax=Dokdonella sp. TaxID=2291710 RepID=UPI003527B89A
MVPKAILVAWSGGKDCLMALERLLADPQWRVTGLLTTMDRAADRVAMHDVPVDLVRAQAAALGLPLTEMAIDWPAPNEAYESALAAALAHARADCADLRHVAFGDLFLADLRTWREDSLSRLGWQGVFPLWHRPTRELAESFIGHGHRALVTTVDLEQLDGSFCGRDYDSEFLADLPASVDPCGENGEFHTFCHASPLFSRPLKLEIGLSRTKSERFRCMDLRLL